MFHKLTSNFTQQFLFILLFVFLNLSSGFSQNCIYEKNEIDAITELVVKRTAPEILLRINGQPVYIKGQSIGTNKYLKIQYYKYSNYVIQEDREVAFVLSNNEEVTLYPRPMPVDSTKMNDYSDLSSLLIFKLNDEQFEKLTSAPIVTFKYHLISGYVEEPIKGSKQMRLMELLKCLE